MKTALEKLSCSEIAELKKLPAIQAVSLTSEMFQKDVYAQWSRMFKHTKLPFGELAVSDSYNGSYDDRIKFSTRDAFIYGLEMTLAEVPKYINSPHDILREICHWRLKIGK